jgi:hypothetical protein
MWWRVEAGLDVNQSNSAGEAYLIQEMPNQRETLKGAQMKSLAIRAALLSGFGALMLMGTIASTVPAAAKCMIDEGNGRYTPCEALYKSKKCLVDEGNGRYTPCEAMVKAKKTKKH